MAARGEFFRSYHLPVLSAEQNDSQSEEINVIDESQQRTGPCLYRKLKHDEKKFLWSALFAVLGGCSKDNSRSPLTVPI